MNGVLSKGVGNKLGGNLCSRLGIVGRVVAGTVRIEYLINNFCLRFCPRINSYHLLSSRIHMICISFNISLMDCFKAIK